MDGWLKGLVAVTCIVVIAGGIHYAREANRNDAKAEIAAARLMCKQRVKDMSNLKIRPDDQKVIASCLLNKHISSIEVDTAIEKIRLGG